MTLDEFVVDFNTASSVIEIGSTSKVYMITPPSVTKAVAMMRGTGSPAFPNMKYLGDDIAGVTVVPSDALTDSIVMLDATGVAVDSLPAVLDASQSRWPWRTALK